MYLTVGLTWACFQFLLTCFATELVERDVAVAQGSLCVIDLPDGECVPLFSDPFINESSCDSGKQALLHERGLRLREW